MEFDHRKPEHKLKIDGKSIGGMYNAARVLLPDEFVREMDKCDVVCVICHRMRGLERGQYRNRPPLGRA